MSPCCEIDLKWVPQNPNWWLVDFAFGIGSVPSGNKSLPKAGCRSMSPYGISISQWGTILMVSCQKGPTHHAYTWQIGPFWQHTLDIWFQTSQGFSNRQIPACECKHNCPFNFPPFVTNLTFLMLKRCCVKFQGNIMSANAVASPGHQQTWYWWGRINRSLSSMRKDFNYLHRLIVEKWLERQMYFCVS